MPFCHFAIESVKNDIVNPVRLLFFLGISYSGTGMVADQIIELGKLYVVFKSTKCCLYSHLLLFDRRIPEVLL